MNKVWIDDGHGGSDPGAVALGLVEKSINLVMSLSCKAELERHNVLVGMTRLGDATVSLTQRATLANNWGAHYFISIHNNAGGGDRGEVIHSVNNGKGLELANKIAIKIKTETQQDFVKVYSRPSTSSPNKDYYSVIANTKMPAVIVEGAFLDNHLDNNAIDTVEEQKGFGVAIAHGILNQLDVAIKSTIKPIVIVPIEEKPFVVPANNLIPPTGPNITLLNGGGWIEHAADGRVITHQSRSVYFAITADGHLDFTVNGVCTRLK